VRQRVQDAERLTAIEDVLQSDEAEEFLREPELLAHFPKLTEQVDTAEVQWQLSVISHARLRMVQRGITLAGIVHLFRHFVEACIASRQIIATGPYTIVDRPGRGGRWQRYALMWTRLPNQAVVRMW
jgi:hypothetical protein